MHKSLKSFCLLGLFTLLSICTISAQNNRDPKIGDYVRVEMQNGSSFKGTVEKIDANQIELFIEGIGKLIVDRQFQKKLVIYDPGSSARIFDYENPLYSKYYLGESAIGLKKGEAYYQNIGILFNFFSYGVSDNFSIGGGFESVSLFTGRVPIFFVNPKITFHTANDLIHFGVGSFIGFSVQDPNGIGGASYGNITIGDKNNNLTFGVGLPFASEIGLSDNPIIQIAGMGRLTNRLGLVGELFVAQLDDGFFNDGSFTFGTVNIRLITEHAVFDVGSAIASGGAIPVASAALKF